MTIKTETNERPDILFREGARRVAPILRPGLQEEVAARIKKMIEDGLLLPGTRIPERQLCEKLGVSRTPLREAFRALAAEGILELRPRQGATVKRLKPNEIDHMFQVIEALEMLAGELACELISDEELLRIEKLHERMMAYYARRNRRGFFKINQEIHESIVRAAANPVLTRVYEGLSGQTRRLRYMAKNTDAEWSVAAREHEAIMKALKARDKEALGRILRAHLHHKRERIKALVAE